MASQPRRTIELNSDEKPAKPKTQQRQSRLLQPKKLSLHGNRQSRSDDRTNLDQQNQYIRSSSTGANAAGGGTAATAATISSESKMRSRSACYTPLRTPSHGGGGGGGGGGGHNQVSYGFGSGNRGRLFSMNQQQQQSQPNTVDRGIERKHLNDKASKILLKLRSKSCMNSADYLPGGLKSMTSKQFIQIIVFFAKNIIGNGRGHKITENTITLDEIVKWLTQIGYTNLQTKGWMKTPNAPHSYPYLIDLFDFLCNWIDDDLDSDATMDGNGNDDENVMTFENDHENQINNYKFNFDKQINGLDVENIFPNAEYIKLFYQTIKNGFQLWNNQQNDEFEQMKIQLIDKYIFAATGIPTKRQLQAQLRKQTHEYELELKNRVIVRNEELLNIREEKLSQLKCEYDRLAALYLEKKQILNDQTIEVKQKQLKIDEMEKLKENLLTEISLQKLTIEKRNEFIIELNEGKNLIDSEQNTIDHLKDIALTNQMNLTHKQNQFKKLATKFDHQILEIFQKLHGLTEWFGFTIDHLKIDQSIIRQSNLTEQLNMIEKNLEIIQKSNKKIKLNLENQLLQLQTQQKNLSNDLQLIKQKDLVLIEQLSNYNGKIIVTEQEILKRQRENMITLNQLNDSISTIKLTIKISKNNCVQFRKKIDQLEFENNKLVDELENKTLPIIAQRNEYHDKMEAHCTELESELVGLQELVDSIEKQTIGNNDNDISDQ